VVTIRFDFDSTAIQPPFDSHSTAIRPRYDHSTTFVTTCTAASTNRSASENVSGAWAADLPLRAQVYFCDTRSPLRSRSTLRSCSSVFWNVRSPLRCRSPRFYPLRSISVPLSAHMRCIWCFCLRISV